MLEIEGSIITPLVNPDLDPSTHFGAAALAIIEATFPSTSPRGNGRQLQTGQSPSVSYTGDYLDEACYPYTQGYLVGGNDVTSLPIGAPYTYVDAVAACNSNAACAGFTMLAPAAADGSPPVGSPNTWFKTQTGTLFGVAPSPDWSSYVVASNCCNGEVWVANVDPNNYYACGAPFDYNSCCSCQGGDGVNYGNCVNSRVGPCSRPPQPFAASQWCLDRCNYPGSWCYFP